MRERKGGDIQPARHIEADDGLVVVDFRGCNSHDVSAVYQAFALLCARQKVRAALLEAGDEDADGHYALRDTLVTLARIAGIPLGFRLALVASSGMIEKVYRIMQDELRALGCDVRIFRIAREAQQWLCGAGLIPATEGAAPRRAGSGIHAG
jgi:hypothetical protein